jgi:hypothetical protein
MLIAKPIFEERFYHWALQDWRCEIRKDFPRLRSMNDSQSDIALKIFQSLKKEEQWLMAKALVKWRRQSLLRQWNEEFTERDKHFVQLFLHLSEKERWREASRIQPGEFMLKADQKKLKRKKLRQCIIRVLSSVLGDDYEDWGNWEEWRYRTDVGPWMIMTYIDVGGQFHQLCYHHSIIVSEHVRLIEFVSFLSWLGISGQTMWQDLHDTDAEPTAKILARIIKHFMDAVPKLLEGLTPD